MDGAAETGNGHPRDAANSTRAPGLPGCPYHAQRSPQQSLPSAIQQAPRLMTCRISFKRGVCVKKQCWWSNRNPADSLSTTYNATKVRVTGINVKHPLNPACHVGMQHITHASRRRKPQGTVACSSPGVTLWKRCQQRFKALPSCQQQVFWSTSGLHSYGGQV